MGLSIYQVDAFTDKPFFGSPAGVCILPEQVNDGWMQKVAMEMNLSETAFLIKQDNTRRNASEQSFIVVPRRFQNPSRNDKFRQLLSQIKKGIWWYEKFIKGMKLSIWARSPNSDPI